MGLEYRVHVTRPVHLVLPHQADTTVILPLKADPSHHAQHRRLPHMFIRDPGQDSPAPEDRGPFKSAASLQTATAPSAFRVMK